METQVREQSDSGFRIPEGSDRSVRENGEGFTEFPEEIMKGADSEFPQFEIPGGNLYCASLWGGGRHRELTDYNGA